MQETRAKGRVVRLTDAPLFTAQEGQQGYRATLNEALAGGAGPSGGWYRVAAGASNHLDMHPDQDEFYFIHRGRATILLDGEPLEIAAGDTVFVPHGVEHRIVNEAAEDLELFYLFADAAPPFPDRDPARFPSVAFQPAN